MPTVYLATIDENVSYHKLKLCYIWYYVNEKRVTTCVLVYVTFYSPKLPTAVENMVRIKIA